VKLGLTCPCKYPYRCIEGLCRLCIPGTTAETPVANFQCSKDGEWQLSDSSMDFHTQLMITIVVVLLSLLLFVTFAGVGRWVRSKYEIYEGNRRMAYERDRLEHETKSRMRRKRRPCADTSENDSSSDDDEESQDDDDEVSNDDTDDDDDEKLRNFSDDEDSNDDDDDDDDDEDEVEVTESDTDHRNKGRRRASSIKNYSSEDDSDGNSDSEEE